MRKGARIPLKHITFLKYSLTYSHKKTTIKHPSPKSLEGTTHAKMKARGGDTEKRETLGELMREELNSLCAAWNHSIEVVKGTRRENVIAFRREINYFLRFETFLMKHFLLPSSTFLINDL